MQKYREINGNDYVKDSRATINETMQSIQSMNSGTAFPTTNLFEGMKCYRTDLKKTYTLTDVENGTWVEDAHATLADTATKLQTPRTLSLSGKAAGSTTFDGSTNAAINVTSVNADTASKLSTARKINITGNASGSASFDGTSDVSINVSVSQAAHADKATQDTNGNELANAQRYMHVYDLPNNTDFNNVKTTGIYTCTKDSYANRPASSWGVLRVYWFSDNVKQEYIPDNRYEVYERYFKVDTWNAWSKVNAANADTATKLATARAISLTGNATGSANFDGSGNVSISTTVNESKHAAAATALDIYAYRPADANIQKGDGLVRHFLATSEMSKNKPPEGDGHILSFAWDNNGGYDAQLCVNNSTGRINMRGQSAGKWSDWLTVLDSANFNSYTPTKTGGGASGTWGINISGTANTAKVISGFAQIDSGTWGHSTGTYITGFQESGGGSIQWRAEGGKLYERVDGTFWQREGAYEVIDTSTVNNYAPTKTGGGASGTWGINISGNAASATNADKLDGYHASDIINRISAANTGGIVAASLTENGYAKFANGLILQWGKHLPANDGWTTSQVNFPIAFNSACLAVNVSVVMTDDWNDIESSVYNLPGLASFSLYYSARRTRPIFWIAIGY